MEGGVLLCDSLICRLCAEENVNGTMLFPSHGSRENLSELVNKYLPLKVENDGKYPRTLCPGCTIQLEATKSFFDLIIEGQSKLRALLVVQQEDLRRREREKEEYENVFKSINPNSSLQTIAVHDAGQDILMHFSVFAEGPLFSADHELTLRTEGLEKPRKKRGRPPKLPPSAEVDLVREVPKEPEEESDIEIDGKRKRRIKKPSRYSELLQGKEMDRVFREEGVLDEEEYFSDKEIKSFARDNNLDQAKTKKPNEVIGHLQDKNGEDLGQLVMVNKYGNRVRVKQKADSAKKKHHECEFCNRVFSQLGRLEIHRSFHRNIRYQCSLKECLLSFESKFALGEHQKSDGHSGSTLIESLDNYGQVELPQVNNEKEQLLEENLLDSTVNLNCEPCDKNFSCKQTYEKHMLAVHENQKPYSCEKCDKLFNHPSSLVYHREAEHNNGRKFVCNKCKKTFKHKQLLLRHQLVHSNERPHTCKCCGSSFKTRANLVNHMPTHTGEKKYYCPQCGHTFAHKTSLTLHIRWHNGQKPYECDVCKKTFSQKGNLAEHRRIHTGEKPYSCTYCGRRFTTSSQFKLHVKRHTGERPWRCEYCSKTFLHKDTWKCHTRRHRNERPYQCQQCLRGFTEQWALRKHERLHTGEKPHICEVCNKSFADSSNLTKHKKIHWMQKKKMKEGTSEIGNLSIPNMAATNEQESNQILYLTYQDNNSNEGEPQTLVHIVDPMEANDEVEKIDSDLFDDSDILPPSEENEVSLDIQLQQLIDNDGNLISLTTADGQHIKVVTVDDESIQGLMPDGTLMPINLTMQDGKPVAAEIVSKDNNSIKNTEPFTGQNILEEDMELLQSDDQELENTKLQFMANSGQKENKLQFLTEDGQNVCFITTYGIDNTIGNHYIDIQ